MANMYINAMTALWNNVGTLYSAIKMNVTDSGSSDIPASKLIDLQVGAVTKFNADKNGNVYAAGDITALGDLTVGGVIVPSTGDTVALGSNNNPWSDLWLGEEAGIKWGPIGSLSDVVIQHATNKLTLQGGDLLIEEPGTDTQSVVTASATQTLRNKTMDGGIIKDVAEFSTLASEHRIGPVTPLAATVVRRHNGGSVVLAGGLDTTSAYLELYGATHASAPKGWTLSSGEGGKYRFDSALNTHYFQNNAGTNILTIGSDGISASKVVSENGQFSSNTHVYIGAAASGGTIHFRPYGATSATNQATIDTSGNLTASGAVTANAYFHSTNVSSILSASGSAVYLRPHGKDNGAGQFYVDAYGNAYASGNIRSAHTFEGGITNGNTVLSGYYPGAIYFRPRGPSSGDYQVYIDNTGQMVFNSYGGAIHCAAPPTQNYTINSKGQANVAAVIGYCADTAYYGMLGRWIGGVGAWSFFGWGTGFTSGSWTTSDVRVKSEISDCDCHDAYSKVRAIAVKSYRKDGAMARNASTYDEMGWIAQEIEQVFPEAVMDVPIPEFDTRVRGMVGGDTVKATNDRIMLATLWAAVQHQAELIEALQAKIEGK